MDIQIERIRKVRLAMFNSIEHLSLDQLNKIPEGFNNNILWNIAHVIAAQQGVCYLRSNLSVPAEQAILDKYKPGTKPEAPADEAEWSLIKKFLFDTLDQLDQDLAANIFTGYTPWVNRYDIEVNNIDNALNMLFMHEGIHLGYTMALKRMVTQQVSAQ